MIVYLKCLKMIDPLSYKFSKHNFILKNVPITLNFKHFPFSRRTTKLYVIMLQNLRPLLNKEGILKIHLPTTSNAMKSPLEVSQKLKDFADKRPVKQISSSLEPSIPFQSLVNMFHSEDFTLKTLKHENFHLSLFLFQILFNKILPIKKTDLILKT